MTHKLIVAKKGAGPVGTASESFKGYCSQITSLTVVAMAQYSTLIEERDTTNYFFVFLDMGAPPNISRYPVLDRQVYRHLSQSTSYKVTRFKPRDVGKKIPCLGVPFR